MAFGRSPPPGQGTRDQQGEEAGALLGAKTQQCPSPAHPAASMGSLWSSSASHAPIPSSLACPPPQSGYVSPGCHQWALQGGMDVAVKGLGVGCLQAGGDQGPALLPARSGGDGGAQALGQEPRSAQHTPPQQPPAEHSSSSPTWLPPPPCFRSVQP